MTLVPSLRSRSVWMGAVSLLFLFLVPGLLRGQSEVPPLELRVAGTQGEAEVLPDTGEDWEQLGTDRQLSPGDRVRTGPEGRLDLEVSGISYLELKSDGELSIRTLERRKDVPEGALDQQPTTINDIQLKALEGTVQNRIRSHEGMETNFRLETVNAVAGVRGTTFHCEILAGDGTLCGLLDGRIRFANLFAPRFFVDLDPGQQSRLPGGDTRPTQPAPLDQDIRRSLEQFRERARQELRIEPFVGSFSIDGTDFKNTVRIPYRSPRTLTLSGRARAREDGARLRSVTVAIDGTAREVAGREEWSSSFQPAALDVGEQRSLRVVVRARDSLGTRSRPRVLKLVLFHPRPGEGRSLEDRALGMLHGMKAGLEQGRLDRYVDPIGDEARLRIGDRTLGKGGIQSSLAQLLPVLERVSWQFEVRDVETNRETGRVRIRTRSTYGADLVQPLGVDLAALGEETPPASQRQRVLDSFQREVDETFVFQTGPEGRLRLSSGSLGLFIDPERVGRAAQITARWQLKTTLFGLFYFYERQNVPRFSQLIHPQFINRDDNGFRHNRFEFLESVRADLDHLTNLQYDVRVQSIQFQGDLNQARVEIQWDRRARLGNTNQLWLIRDQQTTFRFEAGSSYRLVTILNDPVFGLSSARTRNTLVRGGTLDGSSFAPQTVDNSRQVSSASGDEYPELNREDRELLDQQSEGGEECTEVTDNVTSSTTWNDCFNVLNDITVQSGVLLTMGSQAEVNLADGVEITVNGELDINGSTLQALSGSWGDAPFNGGLTFTSESTGTVDNADISGASLIFEVDGGQLTVRNSTLTGGRAFSLDGGDITIEDNTIQAATSGTGVGIALFTGFPSPSLTLTNNTISGFRTNLFLGDDTLTSSDNTFVGVSSDPNSVGVQVNEGAGNVTFQNEIFRDHGSFAICNETGSDDCDDNADGGLDLSIQDSDFLSNGNAGNVPAIAGGNPSADGTPDVTLDGNYIGGNNNSGCVRIVEETPDDTFSQQYIGVSSNANLQLTPNQASDPGLPLCES